MTKPIVGFGDDYSRRGRTLTMNAFVQVETTPVSGGADIHVLPRRGFIVMPEIDHETGEVIVRVRKDAGPRIGQTVKIGKRMVTVAKRRWDGCGRIQVLDEDTESWYALDPEGKHL